MSLSAELILKRWLPAAATLPLGGSRDVLALDGVDRLRHDHQQHQHSARGQAVPRLVGRHCRQFRGTVGVAKLSLNLLSPVLVWLAAIGGCGCGLRVCTHKRVNWWPEMLERVIGGCLCWFPSDRNSIL